MRSTSLRIAAAIVCACSQLFVRAAPAATYVWQDVTGNWNNAANWSGGIPLSDPATNLQFGSGAANYIATFDLSTPFVLNQLTLNADPGRSNTITSATLTNVLQLSGSTPILSLLGGGAFTIENNVNIATGGSIFVDAGGTLSLFNNSTAGQTLNATAAGSTLTKTGAGKLVLQNLGGNVTLFNIDAGTVTTSRNDDLFGNGTTVNVGAAGTLDFGGFGEGFGNLIGAGTVFGGFSTVITGNQSFSGVMNNGVEGASAVTKDGAGTWNLSGANLTTGAFSVINGTVNLTGAAGSLATSTVRVFGGTLTLDNSAGNNANRIADTGSVLLHDGGFLSLVGDVAGSSAETIGTLNLGGRLNTVTLAAGAGQTATLTIGALARTDFGGVLFRGNNLGAAPGADVVNVFFTTVPVQIGGGGLAGARNISIIPAALGDLSPTGLGNSFVTYDALGGVRPLNLASEYAPGYLAAAAGENVLVTTSETGGAKSINSLIIDTRAGDVFLGASSGGALGIAAGALLTTGNGAATISGFSSVGAGANELILSVVSPTGSLTITDPVDGTAGLTKVGAGNLTLGGINTFSGVVRIHGGTVSIVDDTSFGAASNSLALNGATVRLLSYWTSRRNIAIDTGTALTTIVNTIDTAGFDAQLFGIISGGSVAGLQKNGAGTLRLYGVNTFGLPMTISGGTTAVIDTRSLGSGSGNTLVLNGGGTLRYEAPLTNARALAVGTGGGQIDTAGFDSTMSGVISGANPLTKVGLGTLVLSATNTLTGGITIAEGTISVGAANNLGSTTSASNILTFNGGTLLTTAAVTHSRPITLGAAGGTIQNGGFNSTFSGVFSGSGNLTTAGGGTLTLSAAGTTTGTFFIGGGLTLGAGGRAANVVGFNVLPGGVFLLDNSATAQTNRIGVVNVTLVGDGGFALRGHTSTAIDEAYGNLVLGGGFGNVTVVPGGAKTQLTSAGLSRNGGTVLFRGVNLGNPSGAGVANIVFTGAPTLAGAGGAPGTTNLSIVPYAVGDLSATGVGNTLVTYAATTGIRPLNLTTEYAAYDLATASDNVRITGPASGVVGKTINSLVVDNGGGPLAIAGDGASTLTISSGAVLFSGTGAVTLSGFTALDFTAAEGIVHVTDTSAAGATIAVPVLGSGGFTKSGAGTLTLTAANSFTGGLRINAGTLLFSDAANLGDSGGGIIFGGGILRPTSAAAVLGDRSLTLLGGGGTLDTNGFDLTLGPIGTVAGTGPFTKQGAGVLTLNTPILSSGAIAVLGGTLRLGVDSALGGGPLAINGGTLDMQSFSAAVASLSLTSGTLLGSGTLSASAFQVQNGTINVSLSGSGALVKTTTGVVTLSALNFYTGGTTASGGTLVVAGDGSLGFPTGALSLIGSTLRAGGSFTTNRMIYINPATFDTAGFDVMLAGYVMGVGPLTKTGAGTLTISGLSNPYTGGTIVNDGTLQIAAESSLGPSGAVTLDNSAVLRLTANVTFASRIVSIGAAGGTIDTNGFDMLITTSSSITNTAGTFTKTGAGTLTIESQSGAGLIRVLEGTFRSRTPTSGNFLTGDLFIAAGATVDLNDNGESYGGLSGAGNLILGTGAAAGASSASSTATSTFSGVISGVGTVSFSGTGGSTTLSGANTYVGTTGIGSGFTVRLGADNSLPSATQLTVSGTFNLNGFNQTVGSLLGGGSVVIGSTSGVVFTVGTNNAASSSFTGILSGAGVFRKVGTGKQIFTKANIFTGGLEILGGTVESGLANNFADTLPVTIDGGTYSLLTFSDKVGTVTLTGGTITGTTGVLSANTFDLRSGTVGAILGGTGNLIKNGAGTVGVSSVNTYTGTTTVNAGTLTLASGGVINGAAGVGVAANATFDVRGSVTGNGAINVAGNLNVAGTVGGGTAVITVAGGTLSGAGGSLAGNVIVQNAGSVAPGEGMPAPSNGIGALTVTGAGDALTLQAGSQFYFDFHNASGLAPGTDWDFVNLAAGRLVVDATSAAPVTFHVSTDSILFDPQAGYEWKVVQAGSIFFAGDPLGGSIFIDDSGVFGSGAPFAGQRPVGGSFYVTQHANDLYIGYASVPEPGSLAFCALFGLLSCWEIRRRRRRCSLLSGA